MAAHGLGWLAKGAQEGAAHAFAIGEPGLPRDDFDRVAPLLHHQPGGLDAQMFDRLRRRLAGFCPKSATKLARAQMRRIGELLDR